jgi:hypothetical protein
LPLPLLVLATTLALAIGSDKPSAPGMTFVLGVSI